MSSSIQHPETPLHISGFHLPSKVTPFRSPDPPWALLTTWLRSWQRSTWTWARSTVSQCSGPARMWDTSTFKLKTVFMFQLFCFVIYVKHRFHLPTLKKQCFISSQSKPLQETVDRGQPADGPENLEFSSFMFWRNPLPDIDHELQELLVRPGLALS